MRSLATLARPVVFAALACSAPARQPSTASPATGLADRTLDSLIAALNTVQGEFRDVGHLVFVFASDSRLLEQIGAADERAVPKLVECLERPDFARATAAGVGRVRVGVLCAEALIRTDFFQARNASDAWPAGFEDSTRVAYDASAVDLRRAQRAWRAYLKVNSGRTRSRQVAA